MKRLKANSILTTFILGFSLLLLCSFGTDAAYVILSRYKLQKITEAIAFEYASGLARDVNNTIKTDEEKEEVCSNIINRYKSIYNIMGSGILIFEITGMEYKADRTNDILAVKVTTTSRVLPAFLRFAGVKQILIHSVACAKTERIEIEQKLEGDDEFGMGSSGFSSGKYANANTSQTYTEFSAPFAEDDKTANIVTAKYNDDGDFAIKFGYESRASWWASSDSDMGSGGGFFVLAGYEDDDGETRWVDIGDKTTNITSLPRICVDPSDKWADYESATEYDTSVQCYYCINAASGGSIIFDLAKDTENSTDVNGNPTTATGGQTKRFTHLRVYKAGGTGEQDSDTGEYSNPCDPSFTSSDDTSDYGYSTPYYKYFNRAATITLTLFNNVSIMKLSEYNSFETKGSNSEDKSGSCSI